ncbi:hypothetical protein Droror1_Dr00016780 [Drosera rotundifolia]
MNLRKRKSKVHQPKSEQCHSSAAFFIRRVLQPNPMPFKNPFTRELNLSPLPLFCCPFDVGLLQMEQCGSFGWFYYNEDYEGIGDLKQLLLQSRLELDATILSAQDEITRKEEELIHLRELFFVTMKERDEANAKCEKLTLENFSLQQELQNHQQNQQLLLQEQHKAASITRGMSAEDKCKAGDTNTSFSCSDTEESIVSSQGNTEVIHHQNISTSPSYLPSHITLNLANKRPLPEKGKLLKAVMEAGPLLQTLLLAGQLPKWQHPPPRLDSIEIPPARISSSVHGESSKKRALDISDGTTSSSSCKYESMG